jgi:hypothetical protein
MKQVLGGLFSGHRGDWLQGEIELVRSFADEAQNYHENPSKSQAFNKSRLRQRAERVVAVMKNMLAEEVNAYLRMIASRIVDPTTNLTWDQLSNNCQTFCGKLLGGIFDTVLPKHNPAKFPVGPEPGYLMSFASANIGSVFDSPKYQTVPSAVYFEEFHIAEDLIEYFETWPALPLEKSCAKLLCWPCLNNETCSFVEHMWLMPHETSSVLQLHLFRDRSHYRHAYTSHDPREDQPLFFTDQEWVQNRLQILLGLDSFLGAVGGLSATYQEGIDLLAPVGLTRTWLPRRARDCRLIREPTREGEYNFTISSAEGIVLPFSRDAKMKKHLEKTTVSKGILQGLARKIG